MIQRGCLEICVGVFNLPSPPITNLHTRVDGHMHRIALALLVLPAFASACPAQDAPRRKSDDAALSQAFQVKLKDLEAQAAASKEQQDKLYQRMNQSAKRAIGSMCVECLGARYNRSGPKTPLILSDELSSMTEQPQLETEP